MTIPGGPLDLPADLAERYEEPATALYDSRQLGSKSDRFDLALPVAIRECEAARKYQWPEVADLNERCNLAETWDGANKAAKKLASHLEQHDSTISLRLAVARDKAGLTIKSKEHRPFNKAIADFLRAFADHRYGVNRRPGAIRFGPLAVHFNPNNRLVWPDRSVFLCLSLAHIFRILVKTDQVEILRFTGPIGACACWNEAAAFTCATFEEAPPLDIDKVKDKTDQFRKRHAGKIAYRGWR